MRPPPKSGSAIKEMMNVGCRRSLTQTEMEEKSKQLRKKILTMLYQAGSGHSGGSLSCIDILSVLYNQIMKHDPQEPNWPERDRFILSKGHVCPALYAVLADCGYFDPKALATLRKYGSILQGHPYMHKTPGVEVSSGSLGQGLSIAAGIALGAKMDGEPYRVYCLLGDGETQEGQVWEAAMAASHYQLDNLCAVVDYNGLQIDGKVEEVMNINPYNAKWAGFGWNVTEVDGHDLSGLEKAFGAARTTLDRPTVLIAHTVKGKGVSFMENNPGWHGIAPDAEQLASALKELEACRSEVQ